MLSTLQWEIINFIICDMIICIENTFIDIKYLLHITMTTINNNSTESSPLRNDATRDVPLWRQKSQSDTKSINSLYTDVNKKFGNKSTKEQGTRSRGYDKNYYNIGRSLGYSQNGIKSGNIRSVDKSSFHQNGTRSAPEESSISDFGRSTVIKTTVQNLNVECVKPQRAGVIIYTVVEGATFFGLGLDSRTHDLTDFGGGVIYKIDKNVINGALREFEEETLQIFEEITPEDIKKCPVIYDDKNFIIFIHLSIDPDVVCSSFNARHETFMEHNRSQRIKYEGSRRKFRDPEICGITWLTWEEFQRAIKSEGIIYSRVQRFLNKAGDFSYLL